MTQPREPVFHYGNIQIFSDFIQLGKKRYLLENATSISFKVQNIAILKKILIGLACFAIVIFFFSIQASLCAIVAFLFILHMYLRPRAYVTLRENNRRLPLLRTYDMQAAKTLYSVLQMLIEKQQTVSGVSTVKDKSLKADSSLSL